MHEAVFDADPGGGIRGGGCYKKERGKNGSREGAKIRENRRENQAENKGGEALKFWACARVRN